MGQVLRIDPLKPNRNALQRVAGVVREGGVVVYPTDTIYGLGCSAEHCRAVERIFNIKQRAEQKGLLLLVPDIDTASRLGSNVPPVFRVLAPLFWPGPVTFLLPARSDLSPLIRGERGLVGVRNPDSLYLQLLMELIPGPLVSTSANLSGDQPSGSVAELEKAFAPYVDLFLNGGDVGEPVASTVVDLSVTPPVVVRAGAWAERVKEAIGKL